MLTLILPALLLAGSSQMQEVKATAAIAPACVNTGQNKLFKFQEGPSTPPVAVYSGSIGCAALLTDGAKLKMVPAVLRTAPAKP